MQKIILKDRCGWCLGDINPDVEKYIEIGNMCEKCKKDMNTRAFNKLHDRRMLNREVRSTFTEYHFKKSGELMDKVIKML